MAENRVPVKIHHPRAQLKATHHMYGRQQKNALCIPITPPWQYRQACDAPLASFGIFFNFSGSFGSGVVCSIAESLLFNIRYLPSGEQEMLHKCLVAESSGFSFFVTSPARASMSQ